MCKTAKSNNYSLSFIYKESTIHNLEMNKYQNRRNFKLFESKSFLLETVKIYEKRKNVSQ